MKRCFVLPALVMLLWTSGSPAVGAHLNELMSAAKQTAPAVVKAQRELDLARTAYEEAQLDLGWKWSLGTARAANLVRNKAGELTADVRLTTEVGRSLSANQKIAISLDEIHLDLNKDQQSAQLGPLTAGWIIRHPAAVVQQEMQVANERARAVIQREMALETAVESAVLAVAKAYFDYWKVILDRELAQQQQEIYSLQLEKSKALAKVGRAAEIEVRVAEQRVRVAQLEFAAGSSQRDAALGELARLLGVEKEQLALQVAAWSAPQWRPPAPHADEQFDKWVAQRPELRQALVALQLSEEQLVLEGLGPSYEFKPLLSYDWEANAVGVGLDVTKVKDVTGTNLSASWRLQQSGEWRLQASFAATLGGADGEESRLAALRNAELDWQTAQYNLQQTQEDIADRIFTARADVAAKAARHELQLALLERELLDFSTVQARAEYGAATPADVAEAQFAHVQAEAATHKALYEWQLSHLRWLAIIGELDSLGGLEG